MDFFVMELPSCCCECDACHEEDYDFRSYIYGERFCGIDNTEVSEYEYEVSRPKWCPLKEIQKYEPPL